jgi:predicted phage tail protein
VLLKGFETYLLESTKNNVGFKVFDSDIQLSENELGLRGSAEIKIVPVIGGASGEAKILVGAALIAASYVAAGTPFAAASPFLMNAGIALVVGGSIQLLAGKPQAPEIAEKSDNKPSYVFSGAVNTTAQGHPVPLLYGRMICGSAVISAGIVTHSLQGMAGYYVDKQVTRTKDITAYRYPNCYQTEPPSSYDSKVLITHDFYPYSITEIYERWIWRFSWTETVAELRPV